MHGSETQSSAAQRVDPAASPRTPETPPFPGVAASAAEPVLLAEQDLLSTELLDNRQCRDLFRPLNDFENEIFGPDFACDCEKVQPWLDSGSLFYAAVTGEAVAGHRRILSILSVFITTSVARNRMLRGEIPDYELTPWTAGERAVQPTIYLSSVMSVAPHHLGAMYESLLRDVLAFREAHGVTFHGGFAIATGAAGRRHMARNGFRLLEGYKYRDNYDLMVIDAGTASAPFWTQLLSDETSFVARPESMPTQGPVLPATPTPAASGDDPREVEKRLAEAKAERIRRRLDY
jgi:hypothetical protein